MVRGRRAARGALVAGFAAAVLDVLVSCALAASYLARRWGYLPGLGKAWLWLERYPEPRLLAVAGLATGGMLLAAAARWSEGGAAARRSRRGGMSSALIAGMPLLLPCLAATYLAALAPVYAPLSFVRWSSRYEQAAALAPAPPGGWCCSARWRRCWR
jgi:hypothetical protein